MKALLVAYKTSSAFIRLFKYKNLLKLLHFDFIFFNAFVTIFFAFFLHFPHPFARWVSCLTSLKDVAPFSMDFLISFFVTFLQEHITLLIVCNLPRDSAAVIQDGVHYSCKWPVYFHYNMFGNHIKKLRKCLMNKE